jgi:hypothetical protein
MCGWQRYDLSSFIWSIFTYIGPALSWRLSKGLVIIQIDIDSLEAPRGIIRWSQGSDHRQILGLRALRLLNPGDPAVGNLIRR